MTNARQKKAETSAPNDIDMELEAMHAVGLAIGDLRDHDAQIRIVRWAMERFHADVTGAPNGTPVPEAASADSDLSVDDLDDLFGNHATAVSAGPRSIDDLDGLFENDAPVRMGPRSMDNLERLFEIDAPVKIGLRSMEDFDGLFERDAAVADIGPRPVETLDAVFEHIAPAVTVAPPSTESFDTLFEADAPVVDIVEPSAQPEAELGSLVHDFVADFQQLASQLQDF